MQRVRVTPADFEAAAALVRAIRRAYGKPGDYGHLETFTVHNIHDFARQLVLQGVQARREGL
ncbi:MAG: hypothetical protein H0X69_15185 [Gemmatimonadales bacterium]|nr:hypothetical protein [Gemmatimonadales bacterium]